MVPVQIAVLAHAFRVVKLVLMWAASCLLFAPALVVTVLAHAVGVVLQTRVLALANHLTVLRQEVLLVGVSVDAFDEEN